MIDHDPGGKVRLAMPEDVRSEAIYSPCRQYRYLLQRRWETTPDRSVMFLLMNPSTATEEIDDPTVRKCRTYAMQWGYNHLIIGNVMGYRATEPLLLRDVDDPVGPDNYYHLQEALVQYLPDIICAWGRLPARLVDVEQQAIAMLREVRMPVYVLRLNTTGGPWHPLYLPLDLQPIRWTLP